MELVVVAGALLEQSTGQPLDRAICELLFDPPHLERTSLQLEDAVLRNLAIGHYPSPGGAPAIPTRRFIFPHSLAGAGSTMLTCAVDVLRFAQLHLAGGRVDGTCLVPSELVAAMQAKQLDFPVPALGSTGLGWVRGDADERFLLSHSGRSFGGLSSLLVVPDENVARVAYTARRRMPDRL